MASGSSITEYERWHLLPRAFWLPPHGRGNGLDATGWAPIADLPAQLEAGVLDALRAAGVAGYASAPGGRSAATGGQVVRLWVDSMRYRTAEDVLRVKLAGRDPSATPGR